MMPVASGQNPAVPRILLVDDEERFLRTLGKRMLERNQNVVTANSGLEALRIVSEEPIDVVVLDVKMPGLDGLETLTELKKRHPETVVILLTGHASIEMATEGVRMGAFEYLMKPCDVDTLIDHIGRAYARNLERKRA